MTPKLFSAAESSSAALLDAALKEVLACPDCRGELARKEGAGALRCGACGAEFPLEQGIPVFKREFPGLQEEERLFRDRAAAEQLGKQGQDLRAVAGEHHCVPPMQRNADTFRARFSASDWILDIGTGYAWPWAGISGGPRVIGIDLSLGNLLLAKRLLGGSAQVLLLCADAARLPLRPGVIAGVWSVQAFQLLPDPVFIKMQQELERVLKPKFLLESHHLHPAPLYRFLYRVRGKRLHRRGRVGHMETYRLTFGEWKRRWAGFRGGKPEISSGYSEVFFHPEMGIRPRPYPVGLERWLSSRLPALAGLIARQGILRVESAPR